MQENLLTKNIFSRPGKKLTGVKGIVIHYVHNAGSSALANRNYFEGLKSQSPDNPKSTFASAHFIIGLEGEIIQCLPEDEVAYHVGNLFYKPDAVSALGGYPNNSTLGIELCHPDESGKFTRETEIAAADLTARLCITHKLDAKKDVWTHHQITGKICPKWFVDHPEEFDTFKELVIWKSK
jgi:N-acetylmuramoyl-L-alanine amidase